MTEILTDIRQQQSTVQTTYNVIQTHINVTAMLMHTFGSEEEKLTFDTSGSSKLKQELIQISSPISFTQE